MIECDQITVTATCAPESVTSQWRTARRRCSRMSRASPRNTHPPCESSEHPDSVVGKGHVQSSEDDSRQIGNGTNLARTPPSYGAPQLPDPSRWVLLFGVEKNTWRRDLLMKRVTG